MGIAEYNAPVAENLLRFIDAHGLKHAYVAQKAGYTKQELSYMLHGRKLIKPCDIHRLLCVLGTDANTLFENRKEEENSNGCSW